MRCTRPPISWTASGSDRSAGAAVFARARARPRPAFSASTATRTSADSLGNDARKSDAGERLGVLHENDLPLIDRSEEALRLSGHRDRVDAVAARVDPGQPERAAELRRRSLREIAGLARAAGEQRSDELTDPQARTERILAVEEEDHSRGRGPRGLGHRARPPPSRRDRSGTS